MTDDWKDEYERMRKMYEEMDPFKDMKKMFEELDLHKTTREVLKSVDPYYKNQELMEELAQPKATRAALKLLDQFRGVQEDLLKFSVLPAIQDTINYLNLQNEFNRFVDSATQLSSPIPREDLRTILNEVLDTRVDKGADEIIGQGSSIEINVAFQLGVSVTAVTPAMPTESQHLIEVFKDLTEAVKKIQDSASKQKILNILLMIIFYLTPPPYSNFYDDHFIGTNLNKNEQKQIIKQNNKIVIRELQQLAPMHHVRQVTKDGLRVRKNRNMSGEITGYLYYGQLVEIIEKRNNWSWVRWADETGVTAIEGWTHTIHLKKFK